MYKITCKDSHCEVYNQPYEIEDNPGVIECGICYTEMDVEQINQ